MKQLTRKKPSVSLSKPSSAPKVECKTSRKPNPSLLPLQSAYHSTQKASARKQNTIPYLRIDISAAMKQQPTSIKKANTNNRMELNENSLIVHQDFGTKANLSYLEMATSYKSPNGADVSYISNKSSAADRDSSCHKCLLGGQSSKSMSDLFGTNRSYVMGKRVSTLTSESSTPQIFTSPPPLFPQSDKNEDTRRQLNYELEIDKLRKENIDLRGKLREKRQAATKLEYEKAKLMNEVQETNVEFENIIAKVKATLNSKDVKTVKAELEAVINEYYCNKRKGDVSAE